MSECATCDGFGWRPEGAESGWYGRDWRLLLDPTVEWERCPDCGDPRPPMVQLHERLARAALARIDASVADWEHRGAWRRGVDGDGQVVYRWRDIACVLPGSLLAPHAFVLISPLGVQRDLGPSLVRDHLRRLGAPELP